MHIDRHVFPSPAQPAIPPRPPGYDEHPVEKRKGPPPIPQPYVVSKALVEGGHRGTMCYMHPFCID